MDVSRTESGGITPLGDISRPIQFNNFIKRPTPKCSKHKPQRPIMPIHKKLDFSSKDDDDLDATFLAHRDTSARLEAKIPLSSPSTKKSVRFATEMSPVALDRKQKAQHLLRVHQRYQTTAALTKPHMSFNRSRSCTKLPV